MSSEIEGLSLKDWIIANRTINIRMIVRNAQESLFETFRNEGDFCAALLHLFSVITGSHRLILSNFSFIAIAATLSPTNKTGIVERKERGKKGKGRGEKSNVAGLRAIRAAWRFNERVNV